MREPHIIRVSEGTDVNALQTRYEQLGLKAVFVECADGSKWLALGRDWKELDIAVQACEESW